jgi:hypothetical protein
LHNGKGEVESIRYEAINVVRLHRQHRIDDRRLKQIAMGQFLSDVTGAEEGKMTPSDFCDLEWPAGAFPFGRRKLETNTRCGPLG